VKISIQPSIIHKSEALPQGDSTCRPGQTFRTVQLERLKTIAHCAKVSAKDFRSGFRFLRFVILFSWRLLRDSAIESKRLSFCRVRQLAQALQRRSSSKGCSFTKRVATKGQK
jgi:hypothetical protein